MPVFSRESIDKLSTCEGKLIEVCGKAIQAFDFKVIYGHRSTMEQQELYSKGREKLEDGTWVVVDKSKIVTKIDGIVLKGMHNYSPARAIDLAPWPVDWSSKPKAVARFYLMAGFVLAAAHELGVDLRWGGDWDGDFDISDQTFDDLGHFELKNYNEPLS